jgi:hypothetical protein
MWRKEREAAGLVFCEDRPTRKGASLVVENWLDTGKVNPEQIRQAMANIIREIKTNPKARLFDLRTLANSLSKYLDPTKADTQPKKRMWWRWTCGACGNSHVGMVPAGVTPPPVPCPNVKFGHCDGTAHPELEGEVAL